MNKWLILSGEGFLFGPGGITRVVSTTLYNSSQEARQVTALYEGTKLVTQVDETVDEVMRVLTEPTWVIPEGKGL